MIRRLGAAAGLALFLCACRGEPAHRGPDVVVEHRVQRGDAGAGAKLIRHYGCGSCHTIPGIRAAAGLVGPPLIHWSRRGVIAGQLPNTAADLVRWIQNPQSVEPGTAMPNLGVSEAQARDIAAYLYTLR
ncbi:MAG TPA: c-type cytochrome [Longimicrobiaceae bacterium]|nr:c-type cytochrome [Longimicrobiaceae bacterium]